jgi:hypothetical protein
LLSGVAAFFFEVATVRAAVLGWDGWAPTRLLVSGAPLGSMAWLWTKGGVQLLVLSAVHAGARSAAQHYFVQALGSPVSAVDTEDRMAVDICGPPLRAHVLADLAATIVLLPLETAVVQQHIALSGVAANDQQLVPWRVGALMLATVIAAEATHRWANLVLTERFANLLAADISPPADPPTDAPLSD